MIEIKEVDVARNATTLFRNFSWSVRQGECWLVSGNNGSGKSLLLQLIAGLVYPVKGEVLYDFVDGKSWDERHGQKKRNIVYIGSHALQEFIPGHNDLYYQQRYYAIGDEQVPSVQDILADAVDVLHEMDLPLQFSIVDLLPLPVTRLSNGQLKKILLIRSFAKGIPKIMLLDYPFEGLDHDSRNDLCTFIDFLHHRHNVQVIIADHHHRLPECIKKRIRLNEFQIAEVTDFVPPLPVLAKEVSGELSQAVNEEVISIKNLQVKYGEKIIIQNFDWSVKRGERWALVGRNGSGKTTLFSIIFADHPQAYAHDVRLFGKRRGTGESIWDIKRRINYLGPEQISYLNAESFSLTGLQYLQSQNGKGILARMSFVVEFLAAESVMRKQVRSLSSGELQLLMIVNCFLSGKELWLLDEPFQFLDDVKKSRVSDYLNTHLEKDVTLIMITHYDHDRLYWTDRWMQL